MHNLRLNEAAFLASVKWQWEKALSRGEQRPKFINDVVLAKWFLYSGKWWRRMGFRLRPELVGETNFVVFHNFYFDIVFSMTFARARIKEQRHVGFYSFWHHTQLGTQQSCVCCLLLNMKGRGLTIGPLLAIGEEEFQEKLQVKCTWTEQMA